MRAKFIKGLNPQEPIILKLPISADNERQNKDDIAGFVEMVNRTNRNGFKIHRIEIILSDYLQRHYIGEQGAEDWGKKWLSDNECYLNQLKVPYKIIGWKQLVEHNNFKACKEQVDKLYKEDSSFLTIVNNLAKQHSHKADKESARNYLLEECAVFLNMDGHYAYPSTNHNAAVAHVLKKFDSSLKFHGYMLYVNNQNRINQTKENTYASTDELLFDACLSVTSLMKLNGIYTPNKQVGFFSAFVKLKEQFSEPDILEGGIDNEVKQSTGFKRPTQQLA